MKTSLILFLLFISNRLTAQMKLPDHSIEIVAGRSMHSTGDNKGMSFATGYEKYFRKNCSFTIALGATIHDGAAQLFYADPTGHIQDGSYRYTTAGFQITGHAGYSFIRTRRHELQLCAGGVARFQSSSYFDEFNTLYPIATGLPIPVSYFVNTTPQRTYALGASCQLQYNFTFRNHLQLGVLAGFQMDTNGDSISQLSIVAGKRF
jgi:hypothetical protein